VPGLFPVLPGWRPIPQSWHGDKGLSRVPGLPLWMPAPLSDPGGVPSTRLREAPHVLYPLTHPELLPALHSSTPAFPPAFGRTVILMTTTYKRFRGSITQPSILAQPGSEQPVTRMPAGFATGLLARL